MPSAFNATYSGRQIGGQHLRAPGPITDHAQCSVNSSSSIALARDLERTAGLALSNTSSGPIETSRTVHVEVALDRTQCRRPPGPSSGSPPLTAARQECRLAATAFPSDTASASPAAPSTWMRIDLRPTLRVADDLLGEVLAHRLESGREERPRRHVHRPVDSRKTESFVLSHASTEILSKLCPTAERR